MVWLDRPATSYNNINDNNNNNNKIPTSVHIHTTFIDPPSPRLRPTSNANHARRRQHTTGPRASKQAGNATHPNGFPPARILTSGCPFWSAVSMYTVFPHQLSIVSRPIEPERGYCRLRPRRAR